MVAASLLIIVTPRDAVAQPHVSTLSVSRAPTRAVSQRGALFPHGRHAKLFPTCVGCHADMTTSTTSALFPPEASCATCHDGTDQKRVEWRPPARPAAQGLLQFSHRVHFAKTDSAGGQCVACHAATVEGGPGRYMDVEHARAATCIGCHDHRATEHYAADSKCTTCHVPLTRAVALSAADVARLPQPRSHEAATFPVSHAPSGDAALAQCATCHARESCARCHVNVAALSGIGSLGSDARVASALRGKVASYPVPDSHRRETFRDGHGAQASIVGATCATCHARSSCTACHTGTAGADVIRRLVEPTSGTAGVRLINPARLNRRGGDAVAPVPLAFVADTGVRNVRAHARGFLDTHRFSAASGSMTCEGCHTRRFCTDCHAGETRRAFHPANFASAHASDVYTGDRDCASCHNTEVFCRDCHKATGLSSRGGRSGTYHTAQGQWLLQHGRAARQELTTCTTCHTQSSCMRCHSTTGWGVSPHGADFNAERLGRKAMAMCARCHITDPRRR